MQLPTRCRKGHKEREWNACGGAGGGGNIVGLLALEDRPNEMDDPG
jgi:hypothetical protein